jgi:hypothetical protein
MSAATIVLSVFLLFAVLLIVRVNRYAERLENIIIDAADEISDDGGISEMTRSKITCAARSISE